jgi:hypothetical protein
MIDKEKFAKCLRGAQQETGHTIDPDDAVVIVPIGEDIQESICGFRIMYAHVGGVSFAFDNEGYSRVVRLFENMW